MVSKNICRNNTILSESYNQHSKWIKNDIIQNLGKETLEKISKRVINEPSLNIKIKLIV